ncbi:MAG: TlpA family protein disulfide reductase [Polyangiaceae bacterium]|nr:TlpA family protein disulfide reductase [Polyangiaceae bacterium]
MPRLPTIAFPLLVTAVFLTGSLGWAFVAAARHSGPAIGTLPPPVDLPLVKGKTPRFSLADARGTPVVIEVFASFCHACETAAPTLAEAARADRARDVRFVGISVDDDPFLAAVAAHRWGIPYDVAFDDGGVADAWQVTTLPAVIVVDAQGRVRHVGAGAPKARELEQWLGDVGAARLN